MRTRATAGLLGAGFQEVNNGALRFMALFSRVSTSEHLPAKLAPKVVLQTLLRLSPLAT